MKKSMTKLGHLFAVATLFSVSACANYHFEHEYEYQCQGDGQYFDPTSTDEHVNCNEYSVMGPTKDGSIVLGSADLGAYLTMGQNTRKRKDFDLFQTNSKDASIPSPDSKETNAGRIQSWITPASLGGSYVSSHFSFKEIDSKSEAVLASTDPGVVWRYQIDSTTKNQGSKNGKPVQKSIYTMSQGRIPLAFDDQTYSKNLSTSDQSFQVLSFKGSTTSESLDETNASETVLTYLLIHCTKCTAHFADNYNAPAPSDNPETEWTEPKFDYGTALVIYDNDTNKKTEVGQLLGYDSKALFLTMQGDLSGKTLYVNPDFLDATIIGTDKEAVAKIFTTIGLKVVVGTPSEG